MAPGATREAPRNVILQGDALARLRDLPDACVQCIVTSPPYLALRDYHVPPSAWPQVEYAPLAGMPPIHVEPMICCLGDEPTIDAFVAHIVLVFRELRRVLRADGVCWLNFGDGYAADQTSGLKPKDVMMVPARVALALQADGWWIRNDAIWFKTNPMPDSATDRLTPAHEHLFLLSKRAHYFYDAVAIREPIKASSVARIQQPNFANQTGGAKDYGPSGVNANRSIRRTLEHFADKQRGHSRRHAGFNDRWDAMSKEQQQANGSNRRDVWVVATEQMPAAHFATFPKALVAPCVLAGSSFRACESCGAPWRRGSEATGHVNKREPAHVPNNTPTKVDSTGWAPTRRATDTWTPTCACKGNTGAARSLVLDPFCGAGTVPLVAKLTGRDYLGIDLKGDYVRLSERRLALFGRLGRGQPPPKAGEQAPPSLWAGVDLDGTSEGDEGEGPDAGSDEARASGAVW